MSVTEQNARVRNIADAEREIRGCLRRIRARDYLCGQATYNLGDYPGYISAAPTDYDRALIPSLAAMGVQLIQLHEDWNDPLRLHGADKFHAPDHEGMKAFVRLCHENGIKVIAYVSSGYFQVTDPDYRPEFSDREGVWNFNCYSYTKGSHGNAAWREFLLPRTVGVMEEYGFDGIYNDWGYDNYGRFPESTDCNLPPDAYDPEAEDFLCQLYSAVRQRGGIYKMHCDRNNAPPCRDKVCDYLWVGEWTESREKGVGKTYEPYVVPCQDRHFDPTRHAAEYYAETVPFFQFPLLKTGRPIMGSSGNEPGVTYFGGDEQEFYANVGRYMKDHPDGPFVYSLWSSIPDEPEEPELWRHHMALYAPMVKENSLAYIEVRDCGFIRSPLPRDVYVSVFVNEELYLVVSDLSDADQTIILSGTWRDRETGETGDRFPVKKGTMRYLVRV